MGRQDPGRPRRRSPSTRTPPDRHAGCELMPPHRSRLPMEPKDVIGNLPAKVSKSATSTLARSCATGHPPEEARLGQEWFPGGVAQQAEAGRLNRLQ